MQERNGKGNLQNLDQIQIREKIINYHYIRMKNLMLPQYRKRGAAISTPNFQNPAKFSTRNQFWEFLQQIPSFLHRKRNPLKLHKKKL